MDKPNILYVFTDQQSANMMSCAGNPWLSTPAMDRLAARGVRFDRAYCTNPVCLPSRFSMITGRMPSFAGFRSNDWQQETPGIPARVFEHGLGQLFKEAGYDAYYGGKTHLPGFEPDRLGFDILTYDERDQLAEACAGFIRSRDGSKPYLLYVSLINPHDICFMAIQDGLDPMLLKGDDFAKKMNLTPEQVEIFLTGPRQLDVVLRDADSIPTDSLPPLPPNYLPQAGEPEAIGFMLDQRPFRRKARENYDERRWRLHRWAYCRLTEIVDRQLGIILDALDESGQADNTVIIFTSDHGDHDSAHQLEHKDAPYEEACRIPLIVVEPQALAGPGPGRQNATDNDHLVSNGLDLIPTLCDYAGIAHPDPSLTGCSIRPFVPGRAVDGWRLALPVESEFAQAIVTADYKYVVYFAGARAEQLYDLKNDPGETRNAIDDAGLQGVLSELRRTFGMFYNV